MSQIVHELQDLRYLTWARSRRSSGIAGSFLKAYENSPEGKIYYKLSNHDSFRGIIGHECVNEIIVDRLLTLLGVDHLSYRLIHASIIVDGRELETWLCASKDFKRPGESKLALDAFYQAEQKPGESPMEFCRRMGWEKTIYELLAVDYLILNRDRHGANMEVLRSREQKSIRLAPLFDHGLSFFCRCESEEALEREDVLADKAVQCFVGGRSAFDNLQMIPKDKLPSLKPLKETDREIILDGLSDALRDKWLSKIWDMIWSRWKVYEDFCHQR